MKLIYSISLALLLTLTSCPKESENSKCETCKNAMANMQLKLDEVNCEPLLLEEELGLITEDCSDFESDVLVGYLAETCHKGSADLPESCSNPVLNLLILNFSRLGELPDEVDIEMEYGDPVLTERFPFNGMAMDKDFQGAFTQGMLISFTLFKTNTKEELGTGQVSFRFDRPDKYSKTREVIVLYNASENTYNLNFEEWQ